MGKRHRVKEYTWINGELVVVEKSYSSLESARNFAASHKPDTYKIFDAETGELVETIVLVKNGNILPEYA